MTDNKQNCKPEKPYEGFPMYSHRNGKWAKRINGKIHYFGKWNDPTGALEIFNREYPYIKNGLSVPDSVSESCTIAKLCNAFLNAKCQRVESGELSELTKSDYYRCCQLIVDTFPLSMEVSSLVPAHFEKLRANISKGVSRLTLKNRINRIRTVFNYAAENDLIENPVRFGRSFDRPSTKVLRQEKDAKAERFFEREDLLAILSVADIHMKAMIYLGLNCGYGNNDVASMEFKHIDLERAWTEYPRPKTAVSRTAPLWPETIEAIQKSLAQRPSTNHDTNPELLFVTIQGNAWFRTFPSRVTPGKSSTTNTIAKNFQLTLSKAGIRATGIGFYALRHVFETIAGECRDQVAVDHIMGHAPKSGDMGAVYRHRISQGRLESAVSHVREWLFGKLIEPSPGGKENGKK